MENLISFFIEVGKLKSVKRSGWIVEGVKEPESIADHTFRATLATLVIGMGRKDINLDKAVRMALVHDIAESRIGDILVDWKIKAHGEKAIRLERLGDHGITEEEKAKKESAAMKDLVSPLGHHGNEIMDLWREFEDCKTKEAIFVNSVEKFEALLQAFEYEESQGTDFTVWFGHKKNWEEISDSGIRELTKKVAKMRTRKID